MQAIDLKAVVEDILAAANVTLRDQWVQCAPTCADEPVPAQVNKLNTYLRVQLCAIETINTEQARAGLIETSNSDEWLISFQENVLPALLGY